MPRPQVPPPLPEGPAWLDLTRRGLAEFARPESGRAPQRFDSTLLGIHGVARLDDLAGDEGLFGRAPRSLVPLEELEVAALQAPRTGGWQPFFLPGVGVGLAVWRGMPDHYIGLDTAEAQLLTIRPDTFVCSDAAASVELQADLAQGAPLPGWLRFDPVAGTLTVDPGQAPERTELLIRLQARDQHGREASTLFRLHTRDLAPADDGGRASLSEQLRLAAQARDLLVTAASPSI